jgi:hypothetical protein
MVDEIQAGVLPVLHIGFPKTGTTTLQGALFARHPQIANLGEPNKGDTPALVAIRKVWKSCSEDPKKRSRANEELSRSLWKEALDECPAGCVPVFSKETLTLPDFYKGADDQRLAKALYSVIGPARIVIVARHQIRMIESLYLYHAKGSRYEPLEPWLQANDSAFQLFHFNKVADTYANVFGKENVALFLLEELQADPGDFARRICGFIGVDPQAGAALVLGERRNVRVSEKYYNYAKLRKRLGLNIPLGRFAPPFVRELFKKAVMSGRTAKIKLPPAWAERLEDRYRSDNRRLADEWNLPLERFGYPL